MPDIFSLGRKLLVPKETTAKFHTLEARAHRYLNHYSFRLPMGGQFVPYQAVGKLLELLEGVKTEFEEATAAFLANYSTYQQEMMDKYRAYFHALQNAYPPVGTLRRRFGLDVSIYEIRVPSNMWMQVLTARQAKARSKKAEREQAATEQALVTYPNDLEERMEQWLEEVAVTMRQETVRVCEQLAGAIQNGNLHQNHLSSIDTWVDQFKLLNFLDDKGMEAALMDLRRRVDGKVRDIKRDQEALATISASVSSALAAAQNTATPGILAGQYKRRIRVDMPADNGSVQRRVGEQANGKT